MGASQSTRKITLVDDDKAGVIKLSESLAHRLRGQLEGQQAAAVAGEQASSAGVQEPLPSAPPPPTVTPLPPPPPESSVPSPPEVPVPAPTPSFIDRPIPDVLEPPSVPNVLEPPSVPNVLEPPSVPDVALKSEPPKVIEVVPNISVPESDPVSSEGSPDTKSSEPPAPVVSEPPPALATDVTLQVEDAPNPDIGVAIKAGPSPTLAQPGGSIPPWSIYAEEAHLMVMRLREEKEQEIKNLNLEWRDKLDAREKEFVNMAKLSEEQVASALKEVESLFMKASCSPVCQNQQEQVMNCYQDHPRQSLRCAREVENFTQCVDLSRLQSIMKQEAH